METTIYCLKLLLFAVGVWMIGSSTRKGSKKYTFQWALLCIGIALFMTGVEFMTPADQAWTYWFYEAHQDDYVKAILGGFMMLLLPCILMAVCGKDLTEILSSMDASSTTKQTRD